MNTKTNEAVTTNSRFIRHKMTGFGNSTYIEFFSILLLSSSTAAQYLASVLQNLVVSPNGGLLKHPHKTTPLQTNQTILSAVIHESEAPTLSLSNMDVINVGVRLQREYQTNDVGGGQEGAHCVHQGPGNSITHIHNRETK